MKGSKQKELEYLRRLEDKFMSQGACYPEEVTAAELANLSIQQQRKQMLHTFTSALGKSREELQDAVTPKEAQKVLHDLVQDLDIIVQNYGKFYNGVKNENV